MRAWPSCPKTCIYSTRKKSPGKYKLLSAFLINHLPFHYGPTKIANFNLIGSWRNETNIVKFGLVKPPAADVELPCTYIIYYNVLF